MSAQKNQWIFPRDFRNGDYIVYGQFFGRRFSGWVEAVVPIKANITEVHVVFADPIPMRKMKIESACLWVDDGGKMVSEEGIVLAAILQVQQCDAKPGGGR